MRRSVALTCCVLFLCAGCGDSGSRGDGGADSALDAANDAGDDTAVMDGDVADGMVPDGSTDSGSLDAALMDASATDSAAGDAEIDAATGDAGASDSGGGDAGTGDAAISDSGVADTGTPDTGTPDTGTPDTGTSPCISGATGRYAVRFRWLGSGAGSTAYVRYDANTLPDTSRWSVTAASRSIGYRPVFDDPFLGDGGLDLSGSVFIDVELSTMGLSSIRNVTLAIRGRSFNTTASGSFNWMTFDGSGAAPRNLVANSAPYEWYSTDATSAFVTGNSGVLLRIKPGPSSNSLVVASVEICFDAD